MPSRVQRADRPLAAGIAVLLLIAGGIAAADAPGDRGPAPRPTPMPPPDMPPPPEPLPPPDAQPAPDSVAPAPERAPTIYCPRCGADNPPGSRFCREDGAPLPALDPARLTPKFDRAAETFTREEVQPVLDRVTRAVVRIHVAAKGALRYPEIINTAFGRMAHLVVETGEVRLAGSGFAIGAGNEVVTNAHVAAPLDEPAQIELRTRADFTFKARIVGIDRPTDLALLRIEGGTLPPLPWGDSDRLHIGEETWAIGNPQDIGLSVTRGTISSLGHMRAGLNQIESYLHSDASITHGNSGGPLVDVFGRVVGVSDMGFHQERGQGYSIPSGLARRVVDRLRKGGVYERGFVGLHLRPIDAEATRRHAIRRDDGLIVTSILAGSPAAGAGFREGDVIVGINGRQTATPYLLQEAVSSVGPGKRITLNIDRAGETLALEVTTVLRPAAPRPDPIVELSSYLRARFEDDPGGHGVVIHVDDAFSLAHRNGFSDGDHVESVLPASDWPQDNITMDVYTKRAHPVEVRRLDDLRTALGRAYLGGRFGALFLIHSGRTALAGVAYDEIVPIVI